MLKRRTGLAAASVVLGCLTGACAGRTVLPAVQASAPSALTLRLSYAAPQLPLNTASVSDPTTLGSGPEGFAEQKSDPAPELLTGKALDVPIASPQTTATVSQDLRRTVHDIDIPLNTKVLNYVQLFTGRLKGYLEEGLSRGARFLPMIQAVFRAEGLPLDLAYVPLIESAFKPTAVSRAKARGIWQFMQGTALENGLKTDWYLDERSDPEKATYAAARYLKTLHEMFDGDWHLALAAYNGGPGRVQRAIRASGRKDFWKLTSTTRYLPRETREYVPLILAAVIVAKNPVEYGLTVEPPDMPGWEEVRVAGPVDLRIMAEWAGVPLETIQQLNPELRRWTTPVREDEYYLKMPEGTGDIVEARLAETPPASLSAFTLHAVKKGETLATIAKKLKVTRADLAAANYLSTRATLKPGQQLIVPKAPKYPADPQPDVLLAVNTAGAPGVVPAFATSEIVHRVKRGETLSAIARRYDTTVGELREWNGISGSTLQIGQRLTIMVSRPVAVATN